jgi:ribonuclease P protein component
MKFTSIKSRTTFSEIMKNGSKVVTSIAVLLYKQEFTKEVASPVLSGFFNLGIIASKKTFKKAVSRNFVKRRIRAAVREMDIAIPEGKTINVVCIVRGRAENCDYKVFAKELSDNIRKIV